MSKREMSSDDRVDEITFDAHSCSDEQAALLKKYEDYLMSIASKEMRAGLHRKFGPSDVVQQTYCRAVDKIADYRGQTEEEFRGWLRKILISQMRQNERDLIREKRDMRLERPIAFNNDSCARPVVAEPTDRWPTPSTHAAADEEDERLHKCLARLSGDYQTVIKLRNWDRLSFKEIADSMQRTTVSVQKLWYRAVVKLQSELGSADD